MGLVWNAHHDAGLQAGLDPMQTQGHQRCNGGHQRIEFSVT